MHSGDLSPKSGHLFIYLKFSIFHIDLDVLQAGVKHIVFSALEDSRPHMSKDEGYPTVCQFQGQSSKIPFYDSKAEIKVGHCYSKQAFTTAIMTIQ